ncbi:hypothetical protein KBY65_10485 [Cyanobium sp. Alchichica 3B3-8F6]|jgi:hypothetical protein|nr:hypothetical protein [Synechococcus sp. 8F6]MCP9882898.1 hypothetical protein [Cyanobium sp. Alchichica 3B3-8F6]MCP9942940.1 hypothetical protein [Cyanobium sp. ATX 6E8]
MVLKRAGSLKRATVALTPLAGALAFPLIVPVVLMRVGLPAAMLSAVLIGTAWFVLMLRTAEMPGHH